MRGASSLVEGGHAGRIRAWGWIMTWVWVSLGVVCFGAERGNRYAILIGVEKYEQRELELMFCLNDVERLGKVLAEAGYELWRFTDQEGPEGQPSRENLMRRLPELIGRAGPHATLVVYFTGHGFIREGGKLYLAPRDCRVGDLNNTGIPAEWLREQLAGCESRRKFLILDVCHAGAQEEGSRAEGVSSKELARVFERTAGLYTLASCQEEEKSLIWDTKRQSLFSYWLVEGLRGHADREGKGEVIADDLYQYVNRHVPRVAKRVFGQAQNPDRVVGPGSQAEVGLVELKPRRWKPLLAEIAEQIATMVQLEGIKVVGVPEFVVDAKKAELELGGDFGVLGRWSATTLSGFLAECSGGKFRVVSQDVVQEALQKKGVSARQLRSQTIRGLQGESAHESIAIGGLVVGILRNRVGQRISIQCELWDVGSQTLYGTAGGEAELSPDEWAMLGPSVAVHSNDYRPEPFRPVSARLINQLDQRRQKPHPMQDSEFPYRV